MGTATGKSDWSGLFSPVPLVAEVGHQSMKVEVVGRMGPVAETRDATSVGQVQRHVERAFLWLRPDGWQGRARRNAWSAMVADSQRRQSRMLVAREIGPVSAAGVVGGVDHARALHVR
jgi:hypothetical protein